MHAPAKMGHYANRPRYAPATRIREKNQPAAPLIASYAVSEPARGVFGHFDKSLSSCPNELHFPEKPIIHSHRPV
jgi:hypothetical protein